MIASTTAESQTDCSLSTDITVSFNGDLHPITHEYREKTPTVKSWLRQKIHNPKKEQIKDYFLSFFPFLTWIYRYNMIWFWGDLISGLTVAAILVPQSMAYAGLAKLPPQFGLYSSFVGVSIYWFFATSKVSLIN